MKIVETDNFNGDYPNEKFVENIGYISNKEKAKKIASVINDAHSPNREESRQNILENQNIEQQLIVFKNFNI
jgi:hypothetical protein